VLSNSLHRQDVQHSARLSGERNLSARANSRSLIEARLKVTFSSSHPFGGRWTIESVKESYARRGGLGFRV
jgi:hypothetical protein